MTIWHDLYLHWNYGCESLPLSLFCCVLMLLPPLLTNRHLTVAETTTSTSIAITSKQRERRRNTITTTTKTVAADAAIRQCSYSKFCPSWMQQGIIYEGVGEGFECLAISLSLAATPVSPCCKNQGFLPVTFGEIRPPVGKEVEAGKQITDKKQREVNRKRANPFIRPTVFLAPKP